MMSKLQEQITQACAQVGLETESDFIWYAGDGGQCNAVVRIPSIGANNGMLIFNDYDQIEPYAAQIVDSGFGFSVLSEPSERSVFDLVSFKEMFADWGWVEKNGD